CANRARCDGLDGAAGEVRNHMLVYRLLDPLLGGGVAAEPDKPLRGEGPNVGLSGVRVDVAASLEILLDLIDFVVGVAFLLIRGRTPFPARVGPTSPVAGAVAVAFSLDTLPLAVLVDDLPPAVFDVRSHQSTSPPHSMNHRRT